MQHPYNKSKTHPHSAVRPRACTPLPVSLCMLGPPAKLHIGAAHCQPALRASDPPRGACYNTSPLALVSAPLWQRVGRRAPFVGRRGHTWAGRAPVPAHLRRSRGGLAVEYRWVPGSFDGAGRHGARGVSEEDCARLFPCHMLGARSWLGGRSGRTARRAHQGTIVEQALHCEACARLGPAGQGHPGS